MIRVYFETTSPAYAELVAVFDDEETYNVCYKALEVNAKKHNFNIVTESVDEEPLTNIDKKPDYEEAYHYLMQYWDSLPDEEKPIIHKELKKFNL